ncbi:hypothetical protein M431DRAFT_85563 [Trichoderma harzianum CBS 226.95]|uniref:Uncharacterized protein n=1 Tax=Trichoderma harzianum CBS 226.95 TaxID=983964 RepID=A0A2T4ADM6_TRIHA|nr:hypothetical protein M431DRAFT_85563 [Trichoderma harzianum CBS 226.95]PTB55028.1 hypothetical protein M431DRAFT_85563 [Trichoderma harzianum CBS 226.95]
MSSQSLRSIYRARPELAQAGNALRGYFRQFSTTQSQLDEAPADPNAKPTARQRTRAAASEINSLPRVIDVRSLPKGGMLRRPGGLRGRGTGAGTGTGGPNAAGAPRTASPTGNRFSAANRGRGGSALGAGRGGRTAGRPGGRPGAGKGRAAKKAEGEGGNKAAGAAGPRGKRQDPFERMDPQEQQFDDAVRFGTRTEFKPSLTKEALTTFVPATPATPEGRLATVMENLSILGGRADPVGVPQGLQAKNYAEEVQGNGARFFANVKAREAAEEYLQEQRREKLLAEGKEVPAEQQPIIKDAEEAVKKAILDQAVAGKHETPRFATDPVGISRAWHLRSGTYTQRDVEKFEKKLTTLLGVGAGGKGGKNVKAQAKA